jgi:hypothetical protein
MRSGRVLWWDWYSREQLTETGGAQVSTNAGRSDVPRASDLPERLGITHGMVVQELGYDDDSDESVSVAIEQFLGADLVGEDSDEVVEIVLLWFRDHDGDLVDALVDAITPLADDGVVWLLTPKRGRSGYVEPSDVAEAAPTAGLSQTSMASVGADWTGSRLVTRRSRPEKR